jgi:hypothetical protein
MDRKVAVAHYGRDKWCCGPAQKSGLLAIGM